jgi:hypothetical protein
MISTLCVATGPSLPSAVKRRGLPLPVRTVLLPVLVDSLAQAAAHVNRGRAADQREIASSRRPVVRGPMIAMIRNTVTMAPAIKVKTPRVP